MSQISDSIAQYGELIGINGLKVNSNGVVQFTLESDKKVVLEEINEELLIQVLWQVSPFDALKTKINLLLLADFRKPKEGPFQLLLHPKQGLMMQIRMAFDQVTAGSLSRSVDFLLRCIAYGAENIHSV
jgi:hypothetical protein